MLGEPPGGGPGAARLPLARARRPGPSGCARRARSSATRPGKTMYVQSFLRDLGELRRAEEEREQLSTAERAATTEVTERQARLDLLRRVGESELASTLEQQRALTRVADLHRARVRRLVRRRRRRGQEGRRADARNLAELLAGREHEGNGARRIGDSPGASVHAVAYGAAAPRPVAGRGRQRQGEPVRFLDGLEARSVICGSAARPQAAVRRAARSPNRPRRRLRGRRPGARRGPRRPDRAWHSTARGSSREVEERADAAPRARARRRRRSSCSTATARSASGTRRPRRSPRSPPRTSSASPRRRRSPAGRARSTRSRSYSSPDPGHEETVIPIDYRPRRALDLDLGRPLLRRHGLRLPRPDRRGGGSRRSRPSFIATASHEAAHPARGGLRRGADPAPPRLRAG